MGCPTCGNEGNCIETWEDVGKTYNAFYCEVCSEVYFENYDTLRSTNIRDLPKNEEKTENGI